MDYNFFCYPCREYFETLKDLEIHVVEDWLLGNYDEYPGIIEQEIKYSKRVRNNLVL